jgi:hypothetical protein
MSISLDFDRSVSMSIGYCLINKTKREKITYAHLSANTANELTGNPVTSAITTWYLIKNSGDEIGFVPDQYYEWEFPFRDISWDDINKFKDLTDDIINELINLQILIDYGIEIFDESEPDVYVRRLRIRGYSS